MRLRYAREMNMKIKNFFLAVLVCTGAMWSLVTGNALAEPGCAASAFTLRLACEFDLRDDFYTVGTLSRSIPIRGSGSSWSYLRQPPSTTSTTLSRLPGA